jgi:hypothetical protein
LIYFIDGYCIDFVFGVAAFYFVASVEWFAGYEAFDSFVRGYSGGVGPTEHEDQRCAQGGGDMAGAGVVAYYKSGVFQ